MNEVLGTTAGNALEVEEAMEYLKNVSREPRLDEVVLELCTELLLMTGLESGRDAARSRADDAAAHAAKLLRQACRLSDEAPPERPVVYRALVPG